MVCKSLGTYPAGMAADLGGGVTVQILICAGGEWLAHQVALPFAISGSWLIVVVTAMMSLLRSKEERGGLVGSDRSRATEAARF